MRIKIDILDHVTDRRQQTVPIVRCSMTISASTEEAANEIAEFARGGFSLANTSLPMGDFYVGLRQAYMGLISCYAFYSVPEAVASVIA